MLTAQGGARCRETGVEHLLLGGGVAANSRLRAMTEERCERSGYHACASRARACAPTTARWWRRWARSWSPVVATPSALDLPADSSMPVELVQA